MDRVDLILEAVRELRDAQLQSLGCLERLADSAERAQKVAEFKLLLNDNHIDGQLRSNALSRLASELFPSLNSEIRLKTASPIPGIEIDPKDLDW